MVERGIERQFFFLDANFLKSGEVYNYILRSNDLKARIGR